MAYLALRKKANFLITLFMMMMNTGIPEISTIGDIKYLQVGIPKPHVGYKKFKRHLQLGTAKASVGGGGGL